MPVIQTSADGHPQMVNELGKTAPAPWVPFMLGKRLPRPETGGATETAPSGGATETAPSRATESKRLFRPPHESGFTRDLALKRLCYGGIVRTRAVNDRGQCTWRDERERRQEANVP
jgi:hypothetical protein